MREEFAPARKKRWQKETVTKEGNKKSTRWRWGKGFRGGTGQVLKLFLKEPRFIASNDG